MTSLLESISAFLAHECHLLDGREFEAWLELYDESAHYYMPCRPDADRSAHHSAIIDDNKTDLKIRVTRLGLPSAHTEQPAPCAVRLLSNVTILSQAPLQVRAKLIMHEFQRREFARDDYRMFAATLNYELAPHGESFKVLSKQVDLADAGGSRTMMPSPL